jgi:hypothetical protein
MIEGGEVRIFGAVWGWSGMKLLMKHIYTCVFQCMFFYCCFRNFLKFPNVTIFFAFER